MINAGGEDDLVLSLALFTFVLAACASFNKAGAAVSQADELSIVAAGKKDLAQRLSVRQESVVIASPIEEVTWPDASLGCPEPGMIYAQRVTPGYRFKLQSGEKVYEYHAGKGVVKLCPR